MRGTVVHEDDHHDEHADDYFDVDDVHDHNLDTRHVDHHVHRPGVDVDHQHDSARKHHDEHDVARHDDDQHHVAGHDDHEHDNAWDQHHYHNGPDDHEHDDDDDDNDNHDDDDNGARPELRRDGFGQHERLHVVPLAHTDPLRLGRCPFCHFPAVQQPVRTETVESVGSSSRRRSSVGAGRSRRHGGDRLGAGRPAPVDMCTPRAEPRRIDSHEEETT
jgi:hypothetical protein